MRLIYHAKAEEEILDAARYYEERLPGLGSDFLQAIENSIATILQGPLCWPMIEREVRQFLVGRFPYAIYYRVLDNELRILAIAHCRREPGYWRKRLG